ncbi:MAG TPA: amidohydrolase [Bacteroidetes bacterium]|nr:amidohydrolase [Bacteroidota bacterium]
MNILKISIVQAGLFWEAPEKNREHFSRVCQRLAGKTHLILLPEMFTTGFSMEPARLAETINGTTVKWMQKTAEKTGAAITGSLIIRENGNYFNRLVWASPGERIAVYDKRHLFRMGEEHRHYSAGKERLVVSYREWRICPLICYDLRFPVWSRNRGEYDLLLYVANWPAPRREVWLTLLKARALENQCVVAGVNRTGKDGRGIEYSGDSMVVDARGKILSHLTEKENRAETVSLSIDELREFRKKFPVLSDADDYVLKV